MKLARTLTVGVLALAFHSILVAQDAMLRQRVLYVGNRGSEFEPFLKKHFANGEPGRFHALPLSRASNFDVVLLDWPQSVNTQGERRKGAPLGKREEWHKPTVLLGSAGLNLAVAWKLKGGSGCTCLAPVAY